MTPVSKSTRGNLVRIELGWARSGWCEIGWDGMGSSLFWTR